MTSKDRVLRNVCVSKLREAVGLRVSTPQPEILAHTAQKKTVSKKYLLKVLLLLVKTCHLHISFSVGAENISVLQILNHLLWRIWLKPDTEPDTTERLALTGFTCRFPQDRRTRAASIM